MSFDLLVRRARLRGRADTVHDIAVRDGRIAAIAPRVDGTAATEIDARGGLATESFTAPA
jgi:predicted amidohydrolase